MCNPSHPEKNIDIVEVQIHKLWDNFLLKGFVGMFFKYQRTGHPLHCQLEAVKSMR